MKKSAAALLSEEQFWAIIENSNQGRELARELEKLSADEIFGYIYWWEYYTHQAYKQDLWAVAYVVLGGCSDDGFTYFRYWLLTRGKDVYLKALEDADSLGDEFAKLTDDEYPEWEEAAYVPMEVLESKFGIDFFLAEGDIDYGERLLPDLEFTWSEDDAESIRKVCPKTFAKWWANDRF